MPKSFFGGFQYCLFYIQPVFFNVICFHLSFCVRLFLYRVWMLSLSRKCIFSVLLGSVVLLVLWVLVDWLWWGETDVSELRPLQAFCSSPGDLRCGPWMVILTRANSQLVYQSALAAPSTVRQFCQQRHLCCSPQYWKVSCQHRHLWQPQVLSGFVPSETSLELVGGGRRKWEFSLSVPMGLLEFFYMP
jgi:hypothetical protein